MTQLSPIRSTWYVLTVCALIGVGVSSVVGHWIGIDHERLVFLLPFAGKLFVSLAVVLVVAGWGTSAQTVAAASMLCSLCGAMLLGWLPSTDSHSQLTVAVLLSVLGLAFGKQERPILKRSGFFLGLVVASFGLFSLLTYWQGQLKLTEHLQLPYQLPAGTVANLLLIMVGASVVIRSKINEFKWPRPHRVVLVTGIAGTIATSLAWVILSWQVSLAYDKQSSLLHKQIDQTIQRTVDSRLNLLERMSSRWQALGGVPNPSYWKAESRSYLNDISDLDVLLVLDERLQPILYEGRDYTQLQRILRRPLDEPMAEWLNQVRSANRPLAGSARTLTGAQTNYVVVGVPLQIPGQQVGVLVGLFNAGRFFSIMGGDLGTMGMRVFEGDALVYASKSIPTERTSVLLNQRQIQLAFEKANVRWSVQVVQYLDPTAVTASAAIPIWAIIVGLAGTFFLMLHQGQNISHLQRHNNLQSDLEKQLVRQAYRQRIIDHSLDMLCTIDADGRFVEVSPASFRILGYLPEDLEGREFIDFVVPEDYELTKNESRSITQGVPTVSFRNRYKHKEGHTVHLRWSAEWSAEEQTMYAIAHDISYQILGEKQEEDQRQILSQISRGKGLETILSNICHMAEGQIPGIRCAVMLGDDRKKVLKVGAAPSMPLTYFQHISEIEITPDIGSCWASAFRREPVVTKDVRIHPDWERLWDVVKEFKIVACWSMPVVSDDGEILGTLAAYHNDATEPTREQMSLLATAAELAGVAIKRNNDSRQIEASEQRFRSLFANNPDPVYAFGMDGKFQLMNAAGLAMMGCTEAEIIGKQPGGSVVEEFLPEVTRRLSAALKGEAQRYTMQVVNKSGRRLTLDVSYMPIVVDGKMEGIFGLAKDISEREEVAFALRAALEESNRRTLQLQALGRASASATKYTNFDQLLNHLAYNIRISMPANFVSILLQSPEIETYSASDSCKVSECEKLTRTIRRLYEQFLEEKSPAIIGQNKGNIDIKSGNSEINGVVLIPLKDRLGKDFGVLAISGKIDGVFDEGDIAIANQFAQMTVAMLENSRLFNEIAQAERDLQKQLDFDQLITRSLGEGLIAVDGDGRVIFANPSALGIIGSNQCGAAQESISSKLPLPDFSEWDHLAGAEGEFRGELSVDNSNRGDFAYVVRRMDEGWLMLLRNITTENKIRRALRERDHFFNLSLEMFCLLDLGGKFVQVNPSFANTVAYPIDKLIGMSYMYLVVEDEHSRLLRSVEKLMTAGTVRDIVLTIRDGTGQFRRLQASAAVGDDKIIYCAAHDITEHYIAEQEMQRKNLVLGMAGQSARLGGWSVEANGDVYWAPELSAILEYPPYSVPPLSESLALYHEDIRPTVITSLEALLKNGTPVDINARIQTSSGRWLDARVTGQAVRDHEGRVVRAIGALQDITAWKNAQHELDRLAGRLLATLESITDSFFMLDKNWMFSYVNNEALRVLKVEREAMLGNVLWDVFPGSFESEIGFNYRKAIELGIAQHFESYFKPFSSWYEIHAYPSEDGLAVYFRNITDKKAADEELQNTLKELERSNRELQEFAFVASHDLQEPLRKIQTFSDRIGSRESMLDEEGRDYLRRMNSAASRMQALIRDLLNYSRVGTKYQDLSVVNLNKIFSEAVIDLETAIAESSAQLEISPLPSITGDAVQLRQVAQNLISNAIKFRANNRTPLIKVSADYPESGGCTLYISDNGIGFDQKYLEKIFSPFQRLHARDTYPGTGIGLAIVKKIVDRHGGTITAKSVIGEGSIFIINFSEYTKGGLP